MKGRRVPIYAVVPLLKRFEGDSPGTERQNELSRIDPPRNPIDIMEHPHNHQAEGVQREETGIPSGG